MARRHAAPVIAGGMVIVATGEVIAGDDGIRVECDGNNGESGNVAGQPLGLQRICSTKHKATAIVHLDNVRVKPVHGLFFWR